MSEEEIIKNAKEMIYNAECWIDDEEYSGAEEIEWAKFEKNTIEGLLDLYNKQKENNKKLQEGYDKRVREILKLEQRIEELEEIEEEHQKENGELQERINILEEERDHIKNNLEIDLNRRGVYAQAKGQISQILEYYKNNDKYLKN